ncbi:MAG: aminotransferase class IV, partial [Micromonosporaceae bacterium]
SAGRIELALPPREELAALCAEACAAWPSDLEGVLRVVCTRGPERGGPVTCYATLGEILETQLRQRREGVRIATASLGFTAAARDGAPWMLGGVKSLSYAVNMASQRWAAKQGLDDVLWVSADGYALEAPTSTLLWLEGDVLFTVPVTTGILPGTTARHLLDRAPELDWRAGERMVRPAELQAADGVWLVSSVRGVTAVRELDGTALTVSPQHKALQELAGFDT